MADLFIAALFGHLIGDFLLQSKSMALRKSEPGLAGAGMCTLHVLIYTAAVCLMLGTANPVVVLLVFIPHWVIDRWSRAGAWLKFIKGRTFDDAWFSRDKMREFDIAFTSIVYTVVDGTFHLLMLWAVIRWFILPNG